MTRCSRTLLLAVAIAIAGGILWSGARRHPTPQAEGTAVNGKVTRRPTTRTTLRIGTFNIRGGVGNDNKLDLSRTAGCISDCDIVSLNEVNGADQARTLGQTLGLTWLYAPSE